MSDLVNLIQARDKAAPTSTKPCGYCGLLREAGFDPEIGGPMPDPCFGGFLPGVKFACCGHGVDALAYVTDEDGNYCNGEIAVARLKSIQDAA